jgi:hypothetical protein
MASLIVMLAEIVRKQSHPTIGGYIAKNKKLVGPLIVMLAGIVPKPSHPAIRGYIVKNKKLVAPPIVMPARIVTKRSHLVIGGYIVKIEDGRVMSPLAKMSQVFKPLATIFTA